MLNLFSEERHFNPKVAFFKLRMYKIMYMYLLTYKCIVHMEARCIPLVVS